MNLWKQVKRTLALAGCMAVLLSLVPAAGAVESSSESGSASLPKLSKQEISALLSAAPTETPADIFVTAPLCTAPYAPGAVKQEVLDAAAARLSALRRIAGLPAVTADPTLCAQAQYGAVLLAVSEFSHYPSQPSDMGSDFYSKGQEATSTSNIFAGLPLLSTLDGFMDDSDAGNISRLGHRRWQLNPQMGKVGFGYAVVSTGYQRYTSEKVFDRSATTADYDYIAWPASGNFPNDLSAFMSTSAWSVTVNPSKYRTPSASDLSVTLTRDSDGKTWNFSGKDQYQASNSGLYFNVDNGGYGVSNCIIFRPDGISKYEGVYTVQIDGLRTSSGSAASLTYQVDFFQSAGYVEPQPQPEQPTVPIETTKGVAKANNLNIEIDGKPVPFQSYVLSGTNYVKLRDIAYVLNGTDAQFSVGYDREHNSISLTGGQAYETTGTEMDTPFAGQNRQCTKYGLTLTVNGTPVQMEALSMKDDSGNGYNYVKLRDLGSALGFHVDYSSARGVFIETK